MVSPTFRVFSAMDRSQPGRRWEIHHDSRIVVECIDSPCIPSFLVGRRRSTRQRLLYLPPTRCGRLPRLPRRSHRPRLPIRRRWLCSLPRPRRHATPTSHNRRDQRIRTIVRHSREERRRWRRVRWRRSTRCERTVDRSVFEGCYEQ